MAPAVTAVVLAYGAEPFLERAVHAVLASTGITVDVVVVDNGCTGDGVERVKNLPGVQVITPTANTGYAGGTVLGAAEATGEYVAFVNSDAIVEPEALARIAAVAAEPDVGMAMGSIRVLESPDTMNTAGNPIHYTGMVWAGGHDEPASRYPQRRQVPCGSGCCFVMRRSLWRELGGFAPEYFAYCEDTELSLRLRQRGLTIEYVPDAVVLHHYEFSRNDLKHYLLERNRLIVVATTYQARSLIVLAPMLALTEASILVAAALGGWLKPKLRGYGWLWRNRRWVRARRRQLQHERTVPDSIVVRVMTPAIEASNTDSPPGTGVYNAVSRAYWAIARRLI